MGEDEARDGITSQDIQALEGSELRPTGGALDPSALDWIGRELRGYYEEVLREPVPDRLLALVNRSVARRVFH